MTADLKRISEYLDNLDNRVEQWVQETTAEAADKTLGYMDNQQYELNETIRELDEKISKTKGDTAKLILKQLKSRAKTHQQQIKDRVERINNYLSKLLKLQGKVCQLADKMKSIASVIKTSFPNDNPKVDETSGETLDKALKRKAEDLKKYWDYAPNDFSYAADNAEATFQNRNSITIRHVLGSTLDKILWLLRLFPKYENADLAKPLENKRDDVLSYLDELEGKTTPKTPEPAGTAGKIEPQEKEVQDKTDVIPTLTEDEAQVLNYLNEEHPQIRYQQDIVAVCKRDRKTIRVCLKKLTECRFVSLPEGKKRGYVITSDGKDYLNKHF